jgi:hypothetical protein
MLRKAVGLIAVCLFIASPGKPQREEPTLPGLTSEQIMALIDSASGERALNHIRRLTLLHRWFVSEGYHQAAQYIAEKAREIGLRDITLHRFPADGKIFYSTCRSLPRWTVRSARLSLVSPLKKRLASWEENPITLASNSRSANITAPLVDVGEGTQASDYDGKDVKGKLVLASSPQRKGRIDLVHRLAVLERGAESVVSYRSYHLDDFPDLITWDHINTLELNGKPSSFGFCLSKRMGWELKRLLLKGEKVSLHAEVDAKISDGHFEVVSAVIPGTDLADQEIWFIAHLDHCLPSANDNASGSAAILETAQTLLELSQKNVLPRARRTLRFLWVPEIWGTYAFIAKYPEETKKAIAVINLDMVGEHQKRCRSVFRVTRTPDSTPSFLNDLLDVHLNFLLAHNPEPGKELSDAYAVVSPWGSHDAWNAELIPYSGGSDHFVFMGGVIRVPATMFGSWPDDFYHSSEDTPDKCDPTQLRRVVVLGAMTASSLMNLDPRSGLDLLDLVFTGAKGRLEESFGKSLGLLRKSPPSNRDLREALNIIDWTERREQAALESTAALLSRDDGLRQRLHGCQSEIRQQSVTLRQNLSEYQKRINGGERKGSVPPAGRSPEEIAASRLVPVRNPAFPGPIWDGYLASPAEGQDPAWRGTLSEFQLYEIGAFIDGRRSVLDIRNAVSAECGPTSLAVILRYLKDLEQAELVTFLSPEQ